MTGFAPVVSSQDHIVIGTPFASRPFLLPLIAR
jgi:hypothetical protein